MSLVVFDLGIYNVTVYVVSYPAFYLAASESCEMILFTLLDMHIFHCLF